MYNLILIPLENTDTDRAILNHIKPLVRLCKSKLLLVHVADGFVARNQEQLNLSDSEEIVKDRAYLKQTEEELQAEGFEVVSLLAKGDPSREILSIAEKHGCDLIAMATHGHRWLGDFLFGSVADSLRHRTGIPILMVRAM